MIDDLLEPARWSDSSPDTGTAEQAIGAAFRQVREATEPNDTALARVGRRVGATAARKRGQLIWRLAVAALLIMVTGGAVGAALNRWRRASLVVPEARAPGAADARATTARSHRRGQHGAPAAAEAVAALPEAASVAPPPAEPLAAPPPPVASAPVAPSAPEAPAVSPSPSPFREHRAAAPAPESVGAELIAGAFRDLRSRGDAKAALRSLDQYDRRFPDGLLRAESRVARVEALLMLDRRREALGLLETGGAAGALTRDIRVTRGELLVESDRCADALRDFDAVLTARDGDAAGGRALYGRASCRLRRADHAGARADLTRYLSLHADGPSAAAARRALAALP